MKKRSLLLSITALFFLYINIANGQESVYLQTYPKIVPQGKRWTLNAGVISLVELNNGALISGHGCNAAFLSNPGIISGIIEGEYGNPNNVYTILFEKYQKAPNTPATVYQIKPASFVSDKFNLNELRYNSIYDVGEKKITFIQGQSVYVSSCLIGFECFEWDLTNEDLLLIEKKEKNRLARLQREEEEKNRILKEEERLRKEALDKFLSERKTKVYQLKDVNLGLFRTNSLEVDKLVLKVHQNNIGKNYDIEFSLNLSIDYLNQNKINLIEGFGEASIIKQIENDLKELNLNSAIINDYRVNTEMNKNYSLKRESQDFKIRVSKRGIKLISGNEVFFNKQKGYLENQFLNRNDNLGKYTITVSESGFNGKEDVSLKYLKYKGLGGAGNAVFSIIIPGLGNHFVNGGKGSIFGKSASPWVTTIIVGGLIGSGVALKMESIKNYNLYHTSLVQSDIDNYYDKANSYNQYSYALLGAGAVLWLTDVIWTASKGVKNKKNEKLTKSKFNIAVLPLVDSNKLAFNMTINLN